MLRTKYACAVPKNLGVGMNFRPCSDRLFPLWASVVRASELLSFQIFVILNSSGNLPYPKGEKNGHWRWPYMRVYLNFKANFFGFLTFTLCNFLLVDTKIFEKKIETNLFLACENIYFLSLQILLLVVLELILVFS